MCGRPNASGQVPRRDSLTVRVAPWRGGAENCIVGPTVPKKPLDIVSGLCYNADITTGGNMAEVRLSDLPEDSDES